MSADVELVLLFGALHVVALASGALLLVMFLRAEPRREWRPPDDEDGGEGGRPTRGPEPGRPPGDGIPLPDARQARARLRGPGRLADHRPARERRPSREPERPREPAP